MLKVDCKKVVFNQNWAYTYGGFTNTIKNLKNENKDILLRRYQELGITDVLVVTDYIKEYLNYGMNEDNTLKFYKVSPYLDLETFTPMPFENKKLQIAIMPRKNYNNFEEVLWVTRSKNVSMNLIYINDMTEQQVAQIMKESKIFVSLGYPEGFGLPPLEAMACGCIVIGYHGNAGLEYMNDKNMFIFPNGEILDFAKKLVEVYTDLRDNKNIELYESMVSEAVQTSLKFNIDNTEAQLLEFINTI
jgi:glycosyltransferase involved in cell wall biosynthesis